MGKTRLDDWVTDIPSHMRDWCVHELVDDNGEWKLSELQDLMPAAVLQKFNVIFPVEEGPDLRYWSGESR